MSVLIVDDERNIRESLIKYLAVERIEAAGAEDAGAAQTLLAQEAWEAVVLDLKLPGMSGQELLEWMQRRGLPSPVIMISAHGEISDAVAALKAGARDYLVKPFDPAELVIKLRALVEDKKRENRLETESRTRRDGEGLIGVSAPMRELGERIGKIAAAGVTVLITGESGVGKEAVAREIHRRGPYADEPFAAVNMGGIHEGLMESELFGHEKGSFTGAAARRQGLFELAGRGTIFLDEIGEMPLPLQVKLLRVLQDRKIRRLGSGSDIPVNARIISATNRDPEALVKEGRFREDLYFRLNVFRLVIPPLRERREDIPLLAEHVLAKLCARMGRPLRELDPQAAALLASYDFPGNVRELENILERALIYGSGSRIEAGDIEAPGRQGLRAAPPPGVGPDTGPDAPAGAALSLDEVERRAVLESLRRNGGNRTRAAEELGITRKTLLNKLRGWGL
ncbi:MAG: sigma-54 dependent transcriptional regulator [Spirochaetaceae bacterium]|jgi:two-component system response regulator AtoC|nr:sigma-54 dependent transcriptional regulator [Spirochaetaceae bacterium]